MHLANYVDEVWEQCDICRAFDQAQHVPIAGPATLSMLNGKLRTDLLFLDHAIALRAMDVSSSRARQSGTPFSSRRAQKNPQEACDAFRIARIGVFGHPKCMQMDGVGGWQNEVRSDLRSGRRVKVGFLGAGALPLDS